MANQHGSDTATDLTDSLLHLNATRMVVGILCGLGAGLLMFLLTMALVPVGFEKFWWLQLLASTTFGGNAFNFDISNEVFIKGLSLHIFMSCLCGLIVGKTTRTSSIRWLAWYGFVLGFLCWLAMNMFGPVLIFQGAIWQVGQLTKLVILLSFGTLLGLFMSAASKIFGV